MVRLNKLSTLFLLACCCMFGAETQKVPFKLHVNVVDMQQCQITPWRQDVSLSVRLRFVNSGSQSIILRNTGNSGVVLLASSPGDLQRKIYEAKYISEDYGLTRSSHEEAITLEPGRSVEKNETISFSVTTKTKHDEAILPGTHFLQIGTNATTGPEDPRKWASWPLLSTPIRIRVLYKPEAAPCSTLTGSPLVKE
jgi:hypothetical protein